MEVRRYIGRLATGDCCSIIQEGRQEYLRQLERHKPNERGW